MDKVDIMKMKNKHSDYNLQSDQLLKHIKSKLTEAENDCQRRIRKIRTKAYVAAHENISCQWQLCWPKFWRKLVKAENKLQREANFHSEQLKALGIQLPDDGFDNAPTSSKSNVAIYDSNKARMDVALLLKRVNMFGPQKMEEYSGTWKEVQKAKESLHLSINAFNEKESLLTSELLEVTEDCSFLGEELPCGVPEDFLDLYCPAPELKSQILEQLESLDVHFQQELEALDTEIHEKRTFLDGWQWTDHEIFVYLHELFPPNSHADLQLSKALQRELLAHKSYAELVCHGRWFLQLITLQMRRSALCSDWYRQKEDRLVAGYKEIILAQKRFLNQQLHKEDVKKQKKKCVGLTHKVEELRKEKEKQNQKEEEERTREEELKKQCEAEQQAQERMRREREREEIHKFQVRRLEEYYEKMEKLQKLAEAREREIAERRVINEQRVHWREILAKKAEAERRRQDEEKKALLLASEVRKEKLISQVRGQLKTQRDPERIFHDTKATCRRKSEETEWILQVPLFQQFSYSSESVESDPRIRLESRLRDLGLLSSPAARMAMRMIAPPKPPRRDMVSTITLGETN